MAVLLPNAMATVSRRPHPAPRDERGQPVLGAFTSTAGPFPAHIRELEGETYRLRLDPRVWRVRAGDEVFDGTRTFVLIGEPLLHTLPGNDLADYVGVSATLNPPETV